MTKSDTWLKLEFSRVCRIYMMGQLRTIMFYLSEGRKFGQGNFKFLVLNG